MNNKSSLVPNLYITITRKELSHVYYKLAAVSGVREFRWTAMTGSDRMVAASLEVGKTYWITTHTDRSGTQHWASAKEVVKEPQQKHTPLSSLPKVDNSLIVW